MMVRQDADSDNENVRQQELALPDVESREKLIRGLPIPPWLQDLMIHVDGIADVRGTQEGRHTIVAVTAAELCGIVGCKERMLRYRLKPFRNGPYLKVSADPGSKKGSRLVLDWLPIVDDSRPADTSTPAIEKLQPGNCSPAIAARQSTSFSDPSLTTRDLSVVRKEEKESPAMQPGNAGPTASRDDEEAALLYEAYPRHVERADAIKAIKRALKKAPAEVLLAAVREFAQSPAGQAGQYTPYPATWFKKEKWKDDPREWRKGGNRQAPNLYDEIKRSRQYP
jgi:hypothetical protein